MGFFVAIAAALAATIDAGMQGQAFWLGAAPPEVERLGEPRSEEERLPYRPDWFHFVFMLASAYLAMVRSPPGQLLVKLPFRPPANVPVKLPF